MPRLPPLARLLVPAALFVACADELSTPPAPSGLVVGAVTPAHGYAGDLVRIDAAGLGDGVAAVAVSFGASSQARPERLVEGGLEVRVPEDATDGAVTVQAPEGAGVSPVAFRFDGLGRPRYGRVAAQRDLRPRVLAAVPVGERLLGLVREPYDAAIFLDDGQLLRGLAGVRDVAAEDDAHALVMTASGCEARLQRVGSTGLDGPPIVLSQEDPGCEPYLAFAVADGTALVVTNAHAVAVDLRDGTRTTVAAPEDEGFLGPVAAIGGDRFVVAGDFGAWLVSRDASGWSLREKALPFDDALAFTEAVAAHPSGKVAVLETTGLVAVLDATQWPPRRTAQLGLASPRDLREGVLAFSADGARLAWTREDAGRLTTYDLSGEEPVALTAVPVESPSRVTLGRDGQFLVGSAGGVTVLAQRTGALVDTVTLRAALKGPVVRQVTADGGERAVVEVASSTFSRLVSLDPRTLLPLAQLGRDLGPGRPAYRLVAGGGALVVVRATEVGTEPVACRVEPVADGAEPCLEPKDLDDVTVSADGRAAYVLHGRGEERRVSAFDLASASASATGELLVPWARQVREAAGQLFVVGGDRAAIVPATALREGGPAPREVPFPEGQALLDLAMGGGRLALLLTSLEGVFVGQLAASGGALETAGRFDVGGIFTTVASPSGHHLLWTVAGDAGKRLVGATLLPGGGVREFLRMELPRSCVGGVMTGTGEQFVTIDTDRDLVLAVE